MPITGGHQDKVFLLANHVAKRGRTLARGFADDRRMRVAGINLDFTSVIATNPATQGTIIFSLEAPNWTVWWCPDMANKMMTVDHPKAMLRDLTYAMLSGEIHEPA